MSIVWRAWISTILRVSGRLPGSLEATITASAVFIMRKKKINKKLLRIWGGELVLRTKYSYARSSPPSVRSPSTRLRTGRRPRRPSRSSWRCISAAILSGFFRTSSALMRNILVSMVTHAMPMVSLGGTCVVHYFFTLLRFILFWWCIGFYTEGLQCLFKSWLIWLARRSFFHMLEIYNIELYCQIREDYG